MHEAFKKEFNAYSGTTKELNKKYANVKKQINELFIAENQTGYYSFTAIIDERNRKIKPLIQQILQSCKNDTQKFSFLSSLIHMSVNRQFRARQRMYEFVLYDYLKKITTTLKYIKKKKPVMVEQ